MACFAFLLRITNAFFRGRLGVLVVVAFDTLISTRADATTLHLFFCARHEGVVQALV
jgi:hypothetical protein